MTENETATPTKSRKRKISPCNGEPVTAEPLADRNGPASPKQPPMKRFWHPLSGGSLAVSVWSKATEDGQKLLYSFSLQRSFYESDRAEKPRWTSYLRDIDLPVAMLALQQAYFWVAEQRQATAVSASPVTTS